MQQPNDMPCTGSRSGARDELSARIDQVGWAIFFLWVGAAFLFDVGSGIGLLGVGILTLGMQLVRSWSGRRIERLWVVVGSAFTVAGVWQLAGIDVALVPIGLMALGVVILILALRGSGMVGCRMTPASCRPHARSRRQRPTAHRQRREDPCRSISTTWIPRPQSMD